MLITAVTALYSIYLSVYVYIPLGFPESQPDQMKKTLPNFKEVKKMHLSDEAFQ